MQGPGNERRTEAERIKEAAERQLAKLEAPKALKQLEALSNRLQTVRLRFQPIYQYFFPKSWFMVIGRLIRIVPQADMTRYATELQSCRDEAWEIIELGNAASQKLVAGSLDDLQLHVGRLVFRQLYFDGNFIMSNKRVAHRCGEA